ncbi:hypothetical protein P59_070 [Bacillus phage P59]|nr:hypothetical protein P59_070 [Bacillus phage P59]
MKKRLLTLLMALGMVFGLTACAEYDDDDYEYEEEYEDEDDEEEYEDD